MDTGGMTMSIADHVELLQKLANQGVRIEQGPALISAIATAENLSDLVTAPHYHAPRSATQAEIDAPDIETTNDGMKIARDALGAVIDLGKTFTYLDHLQKAKPFVYWLFNLVGLTKDEEATRDKSLGDKIWREVGSFDNIADAIKAASKLVKE
jgi:hypothetical protein